MIHQTDVSSGRYVRMRSRGRAGVELAFLEIGSRRGGIVKIWRYGWGSRRRELFRLLDTWLKHSGVILDTATIAFLAAAAR